MDASIERTPNRATSKLVKVVLWSNLMGVVVRGEMCTERLTINSVCDEMFIPKVHVSSWRSGMNI